MTNKKIVKPHWTKSDAKSVINRNDILSRISIMTRDIDIAIMSIRLSVRPSVCPSRSGIR